MTASLHGGLIFSAPRGQALNRFCHIAAAALEAAGHSIVRLTVLSGHQARVTSESCLIKLRVCAMTCPDESRAQPRTDFRLELGLTPAAPGAHDIGVQERLLLTLLYNMSRASRAREVEWLSPDTRLPAARFAETLDEALPARLTPELMPGHSPFVLTKSYARKRPDPQPDLTLSRNLRDMFEEDADRSGTLALADFAGRAVLEAAERVASPVAAAFSAINAVRGGTLRLST